MWLWLKNCSTNKVHKKVKSVWGKRERAVIDGMPAKHSAPIFKRGGIKKLAVHTSVSFTPAIKKINLSDNWYRRFSGAVVENLCQLFLQLLFLKPSFKETHRGGKRTHIFTSSTNAIKKIKPSNKSRDFLTDFLKLK